MHARTLILSACYGFGRQPRCIWLTAVRNSDRDRRQDLLVRRELPHRCVIGHFRRKRAPAGDEKDAKFREAAARLAQAIRAAPGAAGCS